ncbi:homeobox protein CDX-2 [Puma concolor]|uniref:Homeobox protein CDX-2 n=1 Tax=Puma concolor TaxID=9696 RepID=A0A6P6HVJ7_PUMCO|nr:homeobox protein CDX-2 [Puma concolor]
MPPAGRSGGNTDAGAEGRSCRSSALPLPAPFGPALARVPPAQPGQQRRLPGTRASSAATLRRRSPFPVPPPPKRYAPLKKRVKTRTKDKYRVVYTDHQRLELEKEFHYSRYITIRRKAELAATLGLSERQVKIWFQNRRAKERKINKKKLQQQQQQQQQQPQPPPPAPQPPQPPPGPLRSVPEPLSPVSSLQGSVPGSVPGVLGPAAGVLNPTVTQ